MTAMVDDRDLLINEMNRHSGVLLEAKGMSWVISQQQIKCIRDISPNAMSPEARQGQG